MTKTTTPDTAVLADRLRELGSREAQCMPPGWADMYGFYHEAADRIEALERALTEIIMEATSRNHAIDIARRARHGEGRE